MHNKLSKMESDKLCDLMEDDSPFEVHVDNGGQTTRHKSSDGLNVMAKDFKKFFELREKMIDHLQSDRPERP